MGRRFRGSTDMHRSIARTYLRRYWQSHGPRDSQGRVRRDRKPRGCKRRSPEHLREAHPRLAPPQNQRKGMATPNNHDSASTIVFLSHAAADQEIARHLKQVIETCFPQINVFVSSDPEDLPPGDPWVQTVLANLESAKMLLILATERGLNRKWVWFETGAGWSRGLLFIPCCAGKTRKG